MLLHSPPASIGRRSTGDRRLPLPDSLPRKPKVNDLDLPGSDSPASLTRFRLFADISLIGQAPEARRKGRCRAPFILWSGYLFFPFFYSRSFFPRERWGGFLSLNPASFRHRLWVACWTLIDEMALAFSASATGDGRREGLHRRR